jgi:diguanylate cyclase
MVFPTQCEAFMGWARSRMQYPETPEKASKFALGAFKRLNELGVAANPINFAIWYEYFAGKNHDLKKTVDALAISDGNPDSSVYADLYDRFIIAGANIARDREWSDRIDTVTERIVSALTASGSETEEYGAALKSFSGDLKTAESLEQIRGLVADIVSETESMDTRTRELYSRVSQSTDEITELRKGTG